MNHWWGPGAILLVPASADKCGIQMIHLLRRFFPDHCWSARVGIWAHHKLFLRDFHRFWKLFYSCDSTLARMRWRSPRRIWLWRNIFIKLRWWRPIILNINIPWSMISIIINDSFINLAWSLIWNLIVILLFSCRWL